jgi:hypothetical protein
MRFCMPGEWLLIRWLFAAECSGNRCFEQALPIEFAAIDEIESMSDPRGPYDRPGDTMPGDRSSNAGWAIGAIIVIVLLVVAFAFYGNNGTNTASNPPTTTAQRAVPPAASPPATTPAPAPSPGAAAPNR